MQSNTANGGTSFYDLVIQVVSTSDTQYVLRAAIFLTSLSVGDSSNNCSVSGAWSRSGTLALSGSYSYTPVWSADITVNRVYGATQQADVAASWSGVEYWGTTLAAGPVSYVVPARPYSAPAAPTGVSVARVSDAQHTVSWTNNSTGGSSTAAPYSSQRVQRSTDGGAWATVATVSGTATSWTDTTTSADHSYAYRVVADNSTGSATSTASATVYTTPAAPGTPTATKSGADIVLAFTNTARHDSGIKVYASQDGGAFALLATVATANLTSWTHTAPSSSVTWAYKVATYNGSLISAQSAASNTVQLLAAPNAPTNLGPAGVRDATESVTLTWQHNPVDTTAQTKRQTRHRVQGSPTWVEDSQVASSTQSVALTPSSSWGASNGTVMEWAVRTWGQHADPSPWSATSTLTLSSRPTATIADLDGTVVGTSALTVSWAYYQAEGQAQSSWRVALWTGGAEVEVVTGVGTQTSAALSTPLADGGSYLVAIYVWSASGLRSDQDTATFTVDYAEPPVPTLTATWDPGTATVALAITNPLPTGAEIDTDHNDVWRSIDDGPWTLIATGVPPDTAITDWSPTVAGTTAYRVDAVSALPSTTSSAVVTVTTPADGDPSPSLWLSGGPGFSQVCRGLSNIEVTATAGLAEKVLRRYAGRTRPMERSGTAASRVWSVHLDLIATATPAASPASAWLALAMLPGPHLLRTADMYVRGTLSEVTAPRQRGGAVTGIAFMFTESGDD